MFNSPAAMGKFYEILTGEVLSGATISAEKRVAENRAPQVVWFGGVMTSLSYRWRASTSPMIRRVTGQSRGRQL
jgi:hypothetical protein